MTANPIQSELLESFKHGFLGRRGGVSTGVYASLNCRFGSSDLDCNVELNRWIATEAIGMDKGSLATLFQSHSAEVAVANAPDSGRRPRADAMVSKTPGVSLGVLTADCLPVLFADPVARVVGAAHAGWRGSLAGILQNTAKEMEELGARKERIRAVIGPGITQRNYEVGEEFFQLFLTENPTYARYFIQGPESKYLFDLPRFCMDRIRECGVEEVEWVGVCTYGSPEEYFSYRRCRHADEKDFGCQLSLISASYPGAEANMF
ncbi:MAG: peptidoglycan editing factor PgeF [Albidovulum sp.]|nr:peptidoglycan editing factor PgeF [Albidovulum sp.]